MVSSNRWSHGILLSILLSTAGCGRFTASTSATSDSSNAADPITLQASLQDRPEDCLSKTITAVRAKLGLDPDRGQKNVAKGIDEIVRAIHAECAGSGASVSEVALEELLDDAKSNGQLPGFLMDSDGHMYLLLGAIVAADDQTLYQLVHGTSAIALVPAAAISQAKFPKAWKLHSGKQGVSLHVGTGILRVSSLDHNFGQILPNEKVSHTFTLTNVGDIGLVVGKPQTSCGCTTTSLTSDTVLKPGEATSIAVDLQSANVVSTRQFVYCNLTEPETNSSRQVLFSLFGSQTIFKSVIPRAINFGVVQPESTHSRVLWITETPLDRFSIKRIDSSVPSLDWTVEDLDAGNGLRRYKIAIKLGAGDLQAGSQVQTVHVITDSRYSPDIRVPVIFEVAPRVEVVPSIIALGEVLVGEARVNRLRIKSTIGHPFEVKLKSVPPEAICNLEEKANWVELIVIIKLRSAGLWQRNITAIVSSDAQDDVIDIKCSGLGKQRDELPPTRNGK